MIKRDVAALYGAARDPRVPWYAKALAIVVASYALSPIDLIPDFIPVLGYLDDIVLVPLGIYFAVKLIPPEIMAEHRELAAVSIGSTCQPGSSKVYCRGLGRCSSDIQLVCIPAVFQIGTAPLPIWPTSAKHFD